MFGAKKYYNDALLNGRNTGHLKTRKTVHPDGLQNYLVYPQGNVKEIQIGSDSLVEGFTVEATYRICGKDGIVVCKKK